MQTIESIPPIDLNKTRWNDVMSSVGVAQSLYFRATGKWRGGVWVTDNHIVYSPAIYATREDADAEAARKFEETKGKGK